MMSRGLKNGVYVLSNQYPTKNVAWSEVFLNQNLQTTHDCTRAAHTVLPRYPSSSQPFRMCWTTD